MPKTTRKPSPPRRTPIRAMASPPTALTPPPLPSTGTPSLASSGQDPDRKPSATPTPARFYTTVPAIRALLCLNRRAVHHHTPQKDHRVRGLTPQASSIPSRRRRPKMMLNGVHLRPSQAFGPSLNHSRQDGVTRLKPSGDFTPARMSSTTTSTWTSRSQARMKTENSRSQNFQALKSKSSSENEDMAPGPAPASPVGPPPRITPQQRASKTP